MTIKVIGLKDSGKGDKIKAGDKLVFHNVYGVGKARRVTVTRTTKQYIFIGEAKYRRDGSMVGDEYKRCCLFVEAQGE